MRLVLNDEALFGCGRLDGSLVNFGAHLLFEALGLGGSGIRLRRIREENPAEVGVSPARKEIRKPLSAGCSTRRKLGCVSTHSNCGWPLQIWHWPHATGHIREL